MPRTALVLTLALVTAAAGVASAQPGMPIVGPAGVRVVARVHGGHHDHEGALRLQITPKDAEVFIDGYLMGIVDDFDGTFQRLHLDAGEHVLEVYRAGYKLGRQKIFVGPSATLKVHYRLQKLGPNDPPQPRPEARQVEARREPPSMGPGAGPRDPRGPEPGRPRPGDRRGEPRDDGDRRPPRMERRERGERGSAYGTLTIRVTPREAEVIVDGDRWELDADGRLDVQVAAGRHHVEVRTRGARPFVTDVEVRPGDTTPVNVSLTPEARR